MSISCDIIRDLLPLYHDDVCSADSKEAISEHLKGCETCREELRLIEADLNTPHISPKSEKSIKAVSAAWKKSKKRAYVKGTIITTIICALLVGVFFGLTQWKVIPVAADVLEVTELSQLSDGGIVFHLFVNDNKNLYFTKFTTSEDGCFYLTPMHSIIETTRTYDIGGFSQYNVFYPPGHDAEKVHPGITLPSNVKKIFVGPVGDGALVWEEGLELPPANAEVEQIMFEK